MAPGTAPKPVLHPEFSQTPQETQPFQSQPSLHSPQHRIPQPDAFAQLLAAALLRDSTSTSATESAPLSTSASVTAEPGEPSLPSIIEREDGSRIEIAEGVVTYFNAEGQPVLRQEGFLGDPTQLLNEVARIQEMIQRKEILGASEETEAEVKDFKEQLQAILREMGIMSEVEEFQRGVASGEHGIPSAQGIEKVEGIAEVEGADATSELAEVSSIKTRKAARVQSGPIILTPKEVLGLEPAPIQASESPTVHLPQQHRLRAPFESLSRESELQLPAFEIVQTPTNEFISDENTVEVTLDVELIRISRSTMSSISAAGANYASVSSAEELPIEELEDLIDYDDLFNELDIDDEHDEYEMFMDSVGVQTDLSFFDRISEGMVTDPEKHTFGVQTDLTALDETKGPHNLAEALLPRHATNAVQTAPMVSTEAVQTDAEMHDKCTGGEVDYDSTVILCNFSDSKLI